MKADRVKQGKKQNRERERERETETQEREVLTRERGIGQERET